jgi:hypothetical protein
MESNLKTSATDLRTNLYSLLDRVAKSGETIEIDRKGVRLKIVRDDKGLKLSGLKKRNSIVGDPEALLGLDWSSAWKPDVP